MVGWQIPQEHPYRLHVKRGATEPVQLNFKVRGLWILIDVDFFFQIFISKGDSSPDSFEKSRMWKLE